MKIKYDHTIWPLTISIFSLFLFLSLFFHFKHRQNQKKNRQANPYVTTFGWKLNGQILDILNTSTWTSSSSLPSSSLSLNSTTTTAKKINGIEMRNTSLLVTNVNHEHYGHYQCFANNRIGSSQSESVFLNVKCKLLLTLFFYFHHQSISKASIGCFKNSFLLFDVCECVRV